MGAALTYAKVVDQEAFVRGGGKLRPGLESMVRLRGGGPATAAPFFVLRAWRDVDAFEERWRILDPHGRTVHEGSPRLVQASDGDLADQIDDVTFEYSADDYQLVLEADGREVARVDFPVQA